MIELEHRSKTVHINKAVTSQTQIWKGHQSTCPGTLKNLGIHLDDLSISVKYILHYFAITGKIQMMTSSNGNIFRVTGHLCGEFTGLQWIPRTKASDAELWYFLWCAPN